MRLARNLVYSVFEYCCCIPIIVCSIRRVGLTVSIQCTLSMLDLLCCWMELRLAAAAGLGEHFWGGDRPPVTFFNVDEWKGSGCIIGEMA